MFNGCFGLNTLGFLIRSLLAVLGEYNYSLFALLIFASFVCSILCHPMVLHHIHMLLCIPMEAYMLIHLFLRYLLFCHILLLFFEIFLMLSSAAKVQLFVLCQGSYPFSPFAMPSPNGIAEPSVSISTSHPFNVEVTVL